MKHEASLEEGEVHGGAEIAREYLNGVWFTDRMIMHREALASCALAGNRLADICCSTLDRLDRKESVSDRYLMGLAWTIYGLENGGSLEGGV